MSIIRNAIRPTMFEPDRLKMLGEILTRYGHPCRPGSKIISIELKTRAFAWQRSFSTLPKTVNSDRIRSPPQPVALFARHHRNERSDNGVSTSQARGGAEGRQ